MAGRAAQKALETPLEKRVIYCDTVGCEQQAFNRVGDRNLCASCVGLKRHAEAEAYCSAQGLDTIEKKRAYCLRLSRSFGRGGGFASWAKNIKQAGVDRLVLMGGRDDEQVLERLRSAGAIDGRNQLIPHEAREVAAAAYRAERARFICKLEEEAKARAAAMRVPGQDDEVPA